MQTIEYKTLNLVQISLHAGAVLGGNLASDEWMGSSWPREKLDNMIWDVVPDVEQIAGAHSKHGRNSATYVHNRLCGHPSNGCKIQL